jgi:FG-GAP repeat
MGVTGVSVLLVAVVPATSASAASSATVRITPFDALLATLADPAANSADFFGYSVAVSGMAAVVGATDSESGDGAAYIYVKGASGWPTKPITKLKDPAATGGDLFGNSVAVSGATAVVGAYGATSAAGAAYIYVKGASGWPTKPTTKLKDPAATSGDLFGNSVAVSGTTALVGAYGTGTISDAGAAYIYVRSASGWPTKPAATLKDPAATADDSFGDSVAVSGTTAVVGAFGTKSSAGAAYIYVKGASGWPKTPTTKFSDPANKRGDAFGYSVAVSGTTAVVGAYTTTSVSGAAYVYVKGASGWPTTPTTKLKDPAATSGDFFGDSVAVSGTTAVVGAYGTTSDAGVAYIYKA